MRTSNFVSCSKRSLHSLYNTFKNITLCLPGGLLSKRAFYLFKDQSAEYHIIDPEKMPHNGHNTYVPNTNAEWILNDTYPLGEERLQELYLYHVPTKKKVVLGRFHEPKKFTGEWRCDLHPRCDQQGKRVFFDSTHKGGRRQVYCIHIKDIIR